MSTDKSSFNIKTDKNTNLASLNARENCKFNSSGPLFYSEMNKQNDFLCTQKSTEDSFYIRGSRVTDAASQVPTLKNYGLIFDEKDNATVNEESSSSEDGHYSDEVEEKQNEPEN